MSENDAAATNGSATAAEGEGEGGLGDAITDAFAALATADPAEHEFDELQYIDGVDDVDADAKGDAKRSLPFSSIHAPPEDFKSVNRRCFIPSQPIRCTITKYERTSTSHLLNPYLYVIECQHGSFQWTIRRRYKHFSSLHKSLRLFRTAMRLPFGTRHHKLRRKTYMERKGAEQPTIPRMPKRGDSMLTEDELPERMKQLEDYLNAVLRSRLYRNHHDMLDFLEVSQWSFVHELGIKGKEGLVRKRVGSKQGNRGPVYCGLCFKCRKCAANCFALWRKRWLIVKDTYVAYVRPRDGTLHSVMLMDNGWDVNRGILGSDTAKSLTIVNSSRNLLVSCWTKRKAKEWMDALKLSLETYGRQFVDANRYESFAPVRDCSCRARWYVDGSDYMRDVADAMEAAREEIFITDWWLSPEIFLKRPALDSQYWRLDQILLRKAKQGVKVYVMLYKEVEMALGINSFYSKQKLMQHDNIKVMRHPDHASSAVLFWAHHEKLVVVDQNYGFVGGIDLCYGRWDDHFHRLVDQGSVGDLERSGHFQTAAVTSSTPAGSQLPLTLLALAQGTNLVTIGTVSGQGDELPDQMKANVDMVDAALAREDSEPEKADEDGEIARKGETPPMQRRKLLRNMVRMREVASVWSHELADRGRRHLHRSEDETGGEDGPASSEEPAVSETVTKSEAAPVMAAVAAAEAGMLDEVDARRVKKLKAKLWVGKDYANFIVKDFAVDSPFTDLVDRASVPRMPWHDIATGVTGSAARDVARHFIQRWNAIKVEKLRYNPAYEFLLPKGYQTCDSIPEVLTTPSFKTKCQIVRSASQWSAGIKDTEDSIQQAYIDLISRAKHYIYMENQFFISLCGINADVNNRVCEALFQRILRAHKEGAKFRVYVIIPLLPGFEGQVGTAGGTAIQAITHWNYSSICRGQYSLLSRLTDRGVADPTQYICFHGLRTHSELGGKPVTELIYVHSKLMIVDDDSVICGSANINDRSLLGNRDSEVCMVVEDLEFEEGVMNGEPVQVGRYAGSMRRHLFKEHLGLLETPDESVDVRDATSDDFYKSVWLKFSSKNTDVFEKVFRCIPTDSVKSFVQLQEYQREVPLALSYPSRAKDMLKDVRGHLVLLPFHFLSDEDLRPKRATKEGLMPTSLWT
ncbi:phospholipase D1-like isoform X2 [Amphibalanus amphitrite]|uniref:phospholipase D1-like isoform X2 n=1 Tax=Amphibalanus amphitrite TaxID=1232801 RepID=UPI001C90D6E9|nr:phospholipase D1-like isoform X2 [Amphibalanus amphitrite]